MKRDFTQENLDRLIQLFDELRINDNDQTADLANSIKRSFSGVFSMLAALMGIIIDENRNLARMERYSRERLEQIFADISDLDSRFVGSMYGYGLTLDALNDLQEAMATLTELNNVGSDAVSEGKHLKDYFNPSLIRETMLVASQKISSRLTALESGADFTADDFALVPDSVKRERIREMEKNHPEYRKLFEDVLSDSDLTEQQKLDIQYMAYSAPEPYRSIYLEHLKEYSVNVRTEGDGSYYNPAFNTINLLAKEDFENDSRGPYNTFFHESGHAIDDFERQDYALIINTTTENYKYQGRSLNDYLTEDTRNYINGIIDSDPDLSQLTEAQRHELLKSLNLTDDASFDYHGSPASGPMAAYQAKLQNLMSKDLAGQVNECASDVYGGVTNNAVHGTYIHSDGSILGIINKPYWYSNSYGIAGPKVSTGNQESELWAEFFAAKMTHDEEALESIRAHFPQAYEAMEHMAEEMAAN